MKVGNQQSIGSLLAYHASQRQQRLFQQIEGTRQFTPAAPARNADTFTRSQAQTPGAQGLRSDAPFVPRAQQQAPRVELTSYQTEVLKAKTQQLNQNAAEATAFQPAESPEDAASTAPTYTQADVDELLKQFGMTDADEGFDAAMDMNADGRIDVDDLNHMLSNFAEPEEA